MDYLLTAIGNDVMDGAELMEGLLNSIFCGCISNGKSTDTCQKNQISADY